MSHVLLVGLGDLGQGLARELIADHHHVSGIRRRDQAPEGVDLYRQDLLSGPVQLPSERVDLLVVILTPAEYNRAGYQRAYLDAPRRLLDALALRQPLPSILFVSSTAVFGDQDGWVDEQTSPQPGRYNGRVMLAAERQLAARAETTCVRFSGIYGQGRVRLLNKAARIARGEEPLPPPVWSNRIHRDDCVGLLHELVTRRLAGEQLPPLVVGTDSAPACNLEVYRWLAQQNDEPFPDWDDEPTGKRIRSHYLRSRGYRLRYPDYKAGYRALLDDGLRPASTRGEW